MIRLALALTLLLQFLLPPSVLAETYRSLYDQALMASQAGDFARALPLWDQLLDLEPRDVMGVPGSAMYPRMCNGCC